MSRQNQFFSPQTLYRIPRRNESKGFAPIESRQKSGNHASSCTVPQHVAENPVITPYISTSSDFQIQKKKIEENILRNFLKHGRSVDYRLIAIDARLLNSEIIDLTNPAVRRVHQLHLRQNEKAKNYALAWKEVLVKDFIPTEAIIESTRFYYDARSGRIEKTTTRNPKYAGSLRS